MKPQATRSTASRATSSRACLLTAIARDSASARQLIKQTLTTGGCRGFETVHYRKDGSDMILEVNASLVQYQNRPAILTINRDVTERRRSEVELKESQEQLRRLAGHLQTAREDERVAVARTIHDELGQVLTALASSTSPGSGASCGRPAASSRTRPSR